MKFIVLEQYSSQSPHMAFEDLIHGWSCFFFILFKIATRTFKITYMIPIIFLLNNDVLDRTNLSNKFKILLNFVFCSENIKALRQN